MQFSINTNPSATQASLNLSRASDMHRKSLARLSSGQRIVNPADDAGGLAVGNKLDSKLSRLEKIHQNLKNTISFTELQESALRTVGVIITRMSELKTMATDVTKNSSDVENYNKEFVELQKQIEAMTKHKFNGVSLFSNTSKFAETDADGRSGHGVDLARNFVFGEYVAESGAVLGQGSTTTTTVPGSSGSTGSGGVGGSPGSGGVGGTISTPYTLDQWRADYDEWINYDDSNWDNDFMTWMADPEPYGGVAVLNYIKSVRDANENILNLSKGRFVGIEIEDLTPIAGLKSVTILDLPGGRIPSGNIDPLAALPQLEKINIPLINIPGKSLKPLAGLTNLTHLDATRGNLTNLQGVENLKQLEWLDVQGNNITDISGLSTLENIIHLRLDRNQISDISALSNLVNIEGLYLANTNITDLSPLAALTEVNTLVLDNNNIEDISPLASMTKMSFIQMHNNNVSDVSALAGMTNITSRVGLKYNNISDLTPLTALTSAGIIELGGYDPFFEDPPEKENPITQSQKDMLEAALPGVPISWPNIILPDSDEPEEPTTTITTTGYPSLDQFTTDDFTNFTQSVASAMAEVGSHQSRLNMEVRQNESARVNLEAAKSRIMDADMAQESTRFAKTNVLVQSSASMVAQANQLSEIALRLMVNR
jgi:flagellin